MKRTETSGRGKAVKRLALLLMALFFVSCVTGMAVAAGSWPDNTYNSYRIHPANEYYPLNGDGEQDKTRVDGKAVFSTDQVVNFGGDEIFTTSSRDYFSRVKRLEIVTTDVAKNTPIQLHLDVGPNDKNWQAVYQDYSKTELVYTSPWYSSISYGDFNNMMKKISLSFDNTKGVNNASATFTIRAYSSQSGGEEYGINGTQMDKPSSSRNNTVKTYNCTVVFYSYATGEIIDGSEKISYNGENQDISDGILVSPADENGMQVDFQMHITDFSSQIQEGVEYGYQVKKAEEQWSSETPYVSVSEVSKEAEDPTAPLDISVTGLSDATTYTIRGVLITDGHTNSPKYTNEITVRYEKPVINSFTVGNTEKSYKGGADAETMSPTLEATYSNTSYDETITGEDDTAVVGPIVKTELFFTSNKTMNEDGTKDTSEWIPIGSKEDHLLSPEGIMNRQIRYATDFRLERDPSSTAEDPVYLDSNNCAYMIKVTDVISGYSIYQFSNSFAVDSTKPTAPKAVAYRPVIEDGVPTGEEEVVTDTTQPISGAGGSVKVEIAGSVENGSGLKEYQYSMYYLTADQGSKLGSTIPQVYDVLETYTSQSHGEAEYVDWTSVSLQEGEDGGLKGIVNVAKDGYYRIVVRAVDKAERTSDLKEPAQDLYLRVDLAVPNTPEVYLAKETGAASGGGLPSFGPYDNRSYTTDKVWIFARSKPQTGKTITAYEYSTDGGLNWNSFAGKSGYTTTDGTVEVYEKGQYTTTTTFSYDVAFNLSAELDDYNSIIVRARDNLNNNSSASDAVVMRTVGKTPVATSDIEHVGIEVALAIGNTSMQTSSLTPDLKNAAAQKINLAYYGEEGSATLGAADFNPYLYVKNHQCSWEYVDGIPADISCTGPCHYSNCPYKTLEEQGYSIYKPEIVNIKGLSSASAQTDVSAWLSYDVNSSVKTPGDVFGPNEKGYVVYIQERQAEGTEESYPGQVTSETSTSSVRCRPRHIVDMSTGSQPKFSKILFLGHGSQPMMNWLFLHNDLPTKKVIMFSMDTSKVHFHTYVQSGFLFNTTIRQNKSGTWVMSGYRLMITTLQGGGAPVADITGSTTPLSIAIEEFSDVVVTNAVSGGGSTKYTAKANVAFPEPSQRVKNFRLTIEGDYTTVEYTNGAGNCTEAAFETSGKNLFTSKIYTPRPKVDSYQIGTTSQWKDTDCYGFGPIVGYSSHGCYIETRVSYSDISMTVTNARTLAEVVTEPQWGNGKAKFIANISNDAVADFQDPALNAQIQWRLYNDNAKYIGWGIPSNKTATINFLKQMAGSNATDQELARIGMYESNDVAHATQIDDVATYITTQYYDAFGYETIFDNEAAGNIKDQISPEDGVGKGTIFTLDDIGSMKFEVTPEKYLTSSANPDFPAGRWYMVHDSSNGGGGVTDVRNETYSDALEFNLTLPGRYTIYFAPDPEAVQNKLLDPEDAVFDFVVNQKPVAQFTGSIQDPTGNATLIINDTSYDPDAPDGIVENDEGEQIAGIAVKQWRYELLKKSGDSLTVAKSTDWAETDLNGKTILELTGEATLPADAVLTIYERVTDVVATREAVKDGEGNVIGYTYEPREGNVSTVCQRNITNATQAVTNPPLSTMALDKVYMYDTADEATDASNSTITVTRNSSHPQGKPFAVSWAIDMSAMGSRYNNIPKIGDTNYIALTKSGNDYKVNLGSGLVTVLKCVKEPDSSGDVGGGVGAGSTGGVWEISYDFISEYVEVGKSMVLQITETSYGYNGSETTQIKDQSARAIFYEKDTLAPSPQTVITKTITKDLSSDKETESDYEASKYLDVTDGSKSIRITASGSKDGQGKLGGYAYYLYTKNAAGDPAAYYKLNADGTITKQSQAQAINRVTSDSAVINLTDKILPTGSPSFSISVALWAYDNQSSVSGSLTGGNETKPTKIEDIKFTRSEPMPAAITANDSTGKVVSKISNENGYYGSTATDQESSPDGLDFWSSTDVTVKFQPRQDKYKQDASGNYVKSDAADAQLFFEDIYKAADLTNTANIRYTAYKKDGNGAYQVIPGMNNVEIPYTSTVVFSETGEYKLEARVVNGSNAVSQSRTIHFNVDKQPPTDPIVTYTDGMTGGTYIGGETSREVTATVGNSTDNYPDTAYYQMSIDGGASWQVMDQPSAGLFEHTKVFNTTGTYQVRVRAVDKAGNTSATQSQTVQIDSTAPVVPEPAVTVRSSDETQFTDYLVYLEQTGPGQLYFLNEDGSENHRDTIVAVPLDGSKSFLLKPDAGAQIQSLTYGSDDVLEKAVDNGDGTWTITLENVSEDKVLSAVFASSGSALKQSGGMETETASQMFFAAASLMRTASGGEDNATMEADEKTADAFADDGTFTVTVNDATGGSYPASQDVTSGSTATITILRPENQGLASVTVKRGEKEPVDVTEACQKSFAGGSYQCIVENVTTDVVVDIQWKEVSAYTMTVKEVGALDPAVTVDQTSGGWQSTIGENTYKVFGGEQLKFLVNPSGSYVLQSVQIGDEEPTPVSDISSEYWLEVPEKDFTITFTFSYSGEKNKITLWSEVLPGEDEQRHGSISPADGTEIPLENAGGATVTFVMTPDPGYEPEAVTLYQMGMSGRIEAHPILIDNLVTEDGGKTWKYTAESLKHNGEGLTVKYRQKVVSVTTLTVPSEGGIINCTSGSGDSVPEGSTVSYEIKPSAGYQISDVQVNGESVGKVDTYTFQSISKDSTLTAYFEKRTQGEAKTSHSITVAANSVTDSGVGLADNPYQFRISDGVHSSKFTDRQSANSYTYTNLTTESGEVFELEPNTAYTLTVRAYDKCGNVGESSKTVYTLANEPKLYSAREVDSAGGVTTKTVMLSVNPRENDSEDTEYLVYYSIYPTMQGASVANASVNGGWAKLNNANEFQVSGLEAGTRYYFQIVARNKDGKQTNKDASNIVDIQMSPSAPPEKSLWFEEQDVPSGNITLGWETPPSDVISVEIYRDGSLLASLPSTTTQYVDTSASAGGTLRGDAITNYSYSFVNAAGTGSKRAAISKEYYDAWMASLPSQEPDAPSPDSTKYDAMNTLITKTGNEGLFEQTMTYPTWPKGVNVVMNSMITDGDTNSGKIALYVTTDRTVTSRSQTYELYLMAFDPKKTDSDGTPQPVDNWDTEDHTVKAVATSSSGAYAQWENLNTEYKYQVMVKSISSTGPYTTKDGVCISGYDGSKDGVEYSLGKTFTVTKDTYSISYTNPNNYGETAQLQTVSEDWSKAEAVKKFYLWDQPLNGVGNYIEFNRSPVVERPAGDAIYADTKNVKTDSDGNTYLLVDKANGDMTFRLNVIAYDGDGSPEYKRPSVSGSIAGVNGESTVKIEELWKTAEEARKPANYYQVQFDASKLDTGVYDTVTLEVTDGEVNSKITLDDVKIVVNQSYPVITVDGGGATRKMESGRTYKEGGVTASAEVSPGVTDPAVLRTVRLAVFSEEYKSLFGSNTEAGIKKKLAAGDTAAMQAAKKLMGDEWYNQHVTGGKITVAQDQEAVIDGVKPGLSSYFITDEGTYNKVPAASRDFVTLPDGTKQYWVETGYALQNNLCTWLKRTAGGVQVTAQPNTIAQQVRLRADFGGNSSSVNLYFQIVEPSSMTLQTNRRWVWDEHRPTVEYTKYFTAKATIRSVFEAEAGNEDRPDLTDSMFADLGITGWDMPAYQVKYQGDDKWYTDDITNASESGKVVENIRIFRVVDDYVTVSNDSITGTIDLSTGAYENVEEAFLILDKTGTFDPNNDPIDADQIKVEIRDKNQNLELKPGSYNFYSSSLDSATTYYLWTGYTIGEGQDQQTYYSDEYVTATTEDNFIASYYGFDQKEADYYEKEYSTGISRIVTLPVRREKNADQTSAVLTASIQYLKADQFGNLILDGDGQPIPLSGQELTYAQQTLSFTDGKDTVSFSKSAQDVRQNLSLTLMPNDVKQSHMIARITLDVDRSDPGTEGYNFMFQNGRTMDVFVQDDEDEITSFEIGIDNSNGKLTEVEALGGGLDYYQYQMEGVQVGYGTSETLTVVYRNTGTGELKNIRAEFYTSKGGSKVSNVFRLVQPPTPNLPTVENDPNARGQVMVTASSALPDGVHEAWMKLTADDVEKEIWVKLIQVVGQSTLQGRIYITSNLPQNGQLVGRATVSLYSGNTTPALEKEPLYTTETDLYGGTFKIPNILNDQNYYVVVRRDGYLIYNGVAMGKAFRPTDSKTYEFSLQLLGGDIDMDGDVDTVDYNMMLECFNQSYDMDTPPEDPAELEHWKLLMRCDLNYNGVVNALDRMALQANMNKTYLSYETIIPTEVKGS